MKLKREVVERRVDDVYHWLELDDKDKEFLKEVIFKYEDSVYLTGITYHYNKGGKWEWKTPSSLKFELKDPVKIK